MMNIDTDTKASEDTDKDLEKKGTTDALDADLEANTSAFEALERDFQEVLQGLLGDQSLEKFRLEYEKLHRALKKSHEQEKRLVKKARELNTEIVNNQAKIKTALRLSQEDQKTIAHLQKEMEKTWKLVYASQEKESKAKETISQLKEEMANLSKLVEKGAGMSIQQENLVKELKQTKEELEKELDEMGSQLKLYDKQLHEQHAVQEELREERDKAHSDIADLKLHLQAKEVEAQREQKRREKTQKELMDSKVQFEDKLKLETQLESEIQSGKDKQHDLETQLAGAKATMEKYLRDYDALFKKTQKVTEDLESQVEKNKAQRDTVNTLEKELKLKTLECGRINGDKEIAERKYDREARSVLHYKQLLEATKTPLALAHAEIESLQKELLGAHRHETELKKEAEGIEREKTAQIKETEKAQARVKEKIDSLTEQARVIQSLEKELQEEKMEIQHLKKAIYQLEKDREKLGNEVGEQRDLYHNTLEEVRLRDIHKTELEKRITEWESKMKQQQALYEQVRADRNSFSKSLIESQDEIAEMRKKFKIMDHQIEQLKGEIVSKDQALVKEHFDVQRAEKQKEYINNELARKNSLIKQNHELAQHQDGEIRRLTGIIRKLDDEALSQRKDYDQIINERDILGTQLIRRNDELALLREKLRVQQSALKNGEMQYNARVDDIRDLRNKVKELTKKTQNSNSNNDELQQLRHEMLHMQKELLQEKTKVTALSEELENPLNVHRWRKLEGSDPATFELILKIQMLQKRLIAKTEEVVEKGIVIQEKDKLYNELKAILARQPGPEVAEQLGAYQHTLKQKTRQMKAMASELNMCQAQVNEYRYEIERVTRELQDVKNKYYKQKRKDAMIAESVDDVYGNNVQGGRLLSKTAPQLLQNDQQVAAKAAKKRYAGGGFAIA